LAQGAAQLLRLTSPARSMAASVMEAVTVPASAPDEYCQGHGGEDGGGVGGNVAAGLCDAISQLSPQEDVSAYLQQALLPALGPAIEQLLHHIRETGELQRTLRERARQEQQGRRRSSKNPSPGPEQAKPPSEGGAAVPAPPGCGGAAAGSAGTEGGGPGGLDRQRSRHGSLMEPAAAPDPASPLGGGSAAAVAPMPSMELASGGLEADSFDPLLWLAERLQQSAAGPSDRYRDQVEERILQQFQEEAAAAVHSRGDGEAEDLEMSGGDRAAQPAEQG